jgi:hypothetical protein
MVGDRLVVGHVTLDHSAEVRILVPQLAETETPSHEGVSFATSLASDL